MGNPSREDLRKALAAAGPVHHEYEQNFLGGARDEQWAGWYAAYVLGRLGDFAAPTSLTRWLEEAPGEDDWATGAAAHVARRMVAS